jgi:hypothetical protein
MVSKEKSLIGIYVIWQCDSMARDLIARQETFFLLNVESIVNDTLQVIGLSKLCFPWKARNAFTKKFPKIVTQLSTACKEVTPLELRHLKGRLPGFHPTKERRTKKKRGTW